MKILNKSLYCLFAPALLGLLLTPTFGVAAEPNATQPAAVAAASPSPAVYYGRRLEPVGPRVLHGAGQDVNEFRNYYNVIGDLKPALYMEYMGLNGNPMPHLERVRQHIEENTETYLIPQIGLSMTTDGKPDRHYEQEVADGKWDHNLEAFCLWLKRLNRPVYLRIGYEFNGHWNGYKPESFKAAWKHVVTALRRHELDEVAAVWCTSAGGAKNYMDFYPGDEWVDWWSVDIFSVGNITDGFSDKFATDARERNFPVMIGECTPQKVGVLAGQENWDKWFAPFFRFMKRHPNVKAFCYISWDWSKYEYWRDWGDGRIGANEVVLQHYRQEMRDPIYIHGATAPQIRRALGLNAEAVKQEEL